MDKTPHVYTRLMTDDAGREQLAAMASAAIEQLGSEKETAALRGLIFDLVAHGLGLERRQNDLEAIMLGDDLGQVAGVLIRRLAPAQLTELGLQLLAAGSYPHARPGAPDAITTGATASRRLVGQAGYPSDPSFPALSVDRGAVVVAQLDDSPPAAGDQQVRRAQANCWVGAGRLDPGRAHDLVAAFGDARLTQAEVARQVLDPQLARPLAEALVALADHPARRGRDHLGPGCLTQHAGQARHGAGQQPPACRPVLGAEQVVAAAVAGREHHPGPVPEVGGNTVPAEFLLVRQRRAVQRVERVRSADLLGQRVEEVPPGLERLVLPGLLVTGNAHGGEQRHRPLRPGRADDPLILPLMLVDCGEGLVSQRRPDLALRMAEPDERAQQRRRLAQVPRTRHDLAWYPVRQQDLDRDRAPPQRVARPVAGAEPQELI